MKDDIGIWFWLGCLSGLVIVSSFFFGRSIGGCG